MPLFGRSNRARGASAAVSRTNRRGNFGSHFRRNKDPDRVAGGYKAALSNPNTTRTGRARAKRELKAMGRGREAHVSLATRIKRMLGIRSTPRKERRGVTTI